MEKSDATAVETADSSRSGVIRFEVDNVSTLDYAGRDSPEVEVGGVPWKVNVCKDKLDEDNHLVIYLVSMQNLSRLWSIEVDYEIVLFKSDGSKSEIFKKKNTTFQHLDNMFGSSVFKWDRVVDEEEGFINDNKITVEVHFSIVNIKGIRMADQFDFTDPNEPNHDIALVIDGKKIYANKGILAAHSPVFYAMFYGEFVEKNKTEIEMKDIDREEFLEMLRAIYPTDMKITDKNVIILLKLSDRFQIKRLLGLAEDFLISSSVLEIAPKFLLSDKYRLVKLQGHCFDMLKTIDDVKEMKKAPEFNELSDVARSALLDKMFQLTM